MENQRLLKIFSVLTAAIFALILCLQPRMALAANESNDIQEDVNRIYTGPGTDLAKQIELTIRTSVEKLLSDSLSRGVYMQNVPRDNSGQPVPALGLIRTHYQRFCSPADSSIMGGTGSECSADVLIQNADLKLSNLLSGSRLSGLSLEGAKQFVENLVDPIPKSEVQDGKFPDSNGKPQPITFERIETDPKLQKALAETLINQTVLSVPRHSLAEMITKRQDVPGNAQTLMEQFEQQACQRFMNTAWQKQIKAAYAKAMNICDPTVIENCTPGKPLDPSKEPDPAKAAAIETDLQTAISVCLDFERYKQMERVEVLLSAMVVQQARQIQEARSFISTTAPTGTLTPTQSTQQ